jgi:hypothetical protein
MPGFYPAPGNQGARRQNRAGCAADPERLLEAIGEADVLSECRTVGIELSGQGVARWECNVEEFVFIDVGSG